MPSGFACPYCRASYYGTITRHGPVKCGKCGKVFNI